MHQFDVAIKSLLQDADSIFLQLLTGFDIRTWFNVELPQVQNPRVDRLGKAASGELFELEVQTSNDPTMPLRMALYFLRIYELHGQFPRQIVLYVGKAPLTMPDTLTAPTLSFRYDLVDIRTFNGEDLLASPNLSDNILAILARLNNRREAVRRIISRLATLEEEKRRTALAQLMILAGLRNLETTVKEEAASMSDTINLLENKVLGPMILEAVQKGVQEGLQKEFQEGRQEGRQEASLRMLTRQLEKRFGRLPKSTEDRLAQLSSSELEDLSLHALEIHSPDELFT